MNPTYLFYDLETTGLQLCFDQVLQFAAIRTTPDLKEIERYEWMVQLEPHILIHPQAILIHEITPEQCKKGRSQHESIRLIHQLLNAKQTRSGGYNTLGFDDEFLRFSFHRHLLAPYTHQYANQCARFDIFPIVILYYLFSPETLNWPKRNGRISFKLEELNRANQLDDGPSHQAISDVLATLELTKRLKKNEAMFDYAMKFFDKKTDLARINQIQTPLYLAIASQLGWANEFQSLCIPIGQHAHYKNQSLWLRLDSVSFKEQDIKDLCATSLCIKKRAGESPFILPTLSRYIDKLPADRIQLAKDNLQWMHENTISAETIKTHFQQQTYENYPNTDIQANLYQQAFPNRHDTQLLNQFHQNADQQSQNKLANQFEDPVYTQLANRLCGQIYGHEATENQQSLWMEFQRQQLGLSDKIISDYRNQQPLALHTAIELSKNLLDQYEPESRQHDLLINYLDYLQKIQKQMNTNSSS